MENLVFYTTIIPFSKVDFAKIIKNLHTSKANVRDMVSISNLKMGR